MARRRMVGGQQSRRTASPRSEHEHPKTKLLPKLEIHSDEAGAQDALGGTRREEHERSALVDSKALPVEASSSATDVTTEKNGPITTGAATSFSSATVVRLVNTTGTAQVITVVETQSGTVIGSFTMPTGAVEYLEKNPTQCVFAANAGVLGSKVGFTA